MAKGYKATFASGLGVETGPSNGEPKDTRSARVRAALATAVGCKADDVLVALQDGAIAASFPVILDPTENAAFVARQKSRIEAIVGGAKVTTPSELANIASSIQTATRLGKPEYAAVAAKALAAAKGGSFLSEESLKGEAKVDGDRYASLGFTGTVNLAVYRRAIAARALGEEYV